MRMKMKKFASLNIAGLFIATVVLGSVTTNAALAGQTASEGSVGFTPAASSPSKPYDPTDPNFPPAPIKENPDGKGKGTTGVLRFERVPNFNFGNIEVKAEGDDYPVYDEEYQLVDPTTGADSGKPFYSAPTIEVTDGRGHAPGWHVKAENNQIFSSTNTTVASFKAFIVLNNAVAASYTEGVLASEAPDIFASPIVLNDLPSVPIVNATENNGNAKWGISFYDPTDSAAATAGKPTRRTTQSTSNAVVLRIPNAAKVKANEQYTTTITWYLYDTFA